MNTPHLLLRTTTLCAAFLAGSTHASIITKDYSGINSVLHSGFLIDPGPVLTNAQLQGGSPDGGGTTVYESNGIASDPRITFNSGFSGAGGGSLDLNVFPNFRARYGRTGGTGTIHAWRIAPLGGQNIVLPEHTTGLAEAQGTIPNPNTSSGYRVDPVGSGTGWSIEFDYIYADRGRTLGYEFSHDGDLNGLTANGQISSPTVAGGVLSGTSNGNDPQIFETGLSIDPSIYQFVELRLRTDVGSNRVDFFYGNTNGSFAAERRAIVDPDAGVDGNYHTYLIDFSTDTEWLTGGTVNAFRLDPTSDAGGVGKTFDLDYIRFLETAVIPEPRTLGLALFGCLLLRFRCRFRRP